MDTIAILKSAKRQNFYFKQRDEKQTSKELKSEKIKKRKKKRAKSGQWQERTERRKRRRMQSPIAQVLNASTERERERESHLCKFVRKIFSVLQDFCNCVAVWDRQSFRLFNFFFHVQVSLTCIGMKIRFFFSLLFVEVIVKIPIFILKMLNV